jgi:hypothetical protein
LFPFLGSILKTKKEAPALPGLPSDVALNKNLGCTPLAVAILVVFLSLIEALPALFGLVLSGLATVLTLTMLSGLPAPIYGLAALLPFFLHIVCHDSS